MDIAFTEEKDKFVVIYLDDITIFSRFDSEHLEHLKHVFTKCRTFGISLNPKKCMFAPFQGKLLGHIVSKDGVSIDPKRVEAIQKLALPKNKKEVQSFIGTVNFLRIFISIFSHILREITNMLRKESKIFWTSEEKSYFQ